MTDPFYFSRATLKKDPALEALGPILMPAETSERLQTDHRLMWSLFAGNADGPRDFLFRRLNKEGQGGGAVFLILSKRSPNDSSPIFDVETKPFEPSLAIGDRLRFSLIANPAFNRSHRVGESKVTRRHDVVMDALANVPVKERAALRRQVVYEAGRAWLEGKAQDAGFSLTDEAASLRIDGYDQLQIARGQGRRPISISTLSFDGVISITDPTALLRALTLGFGRARAFGYGLMLIRRA